MSQRLPTVTAAQLRRVLRDLGWVEERQRGSHIRLVNGARALTVADHGGSLAGGIVGAHALDVIGYRDAYIAFTIIAIATAIGTFALQSRAKERLAAK